ncbi:MAG: hypothetical protein P4L27_03830 [Ignavibacteriaceae bacterium]|nr:hypothetical protein [Ignavibacteriaceae bacterium]
MKYIIGLICFTLLSIALSHCGGKKEEQNKSPESYQVENSPQKDADIQRYNLEIRKKNTPVRFPGDTIAIIEYVLNNYPEGTYLMSFDKTLTYNVPKPALIYINQEGNQYALGVIARSKPGERLIESKNIIGYDQSNIDLDSTKLGTAFFYLSLFQIIDNQIITLWEAPIPSHGGLNSISMNRWAYNGTPYVDINFHYAQGIGHIDYNYFLINGLTSFPHLLMTYKGINFKRTIANVNNDKYPDYMEYLYIDNGIKVIERDSIPFVWSARDSVYINTRNKKQTRPY